MYSPLVAAMAATALAAIAAAIAPSVSWLRAIVRKTRVCNCWWRHWQERTHLNLNCLGLLFGGCEGVARLVLRALKADCYGI